MYTSNHLIIVVLIIGFSAICRSQDVTPAEPIFQKAYIEHKAINEALGKAAVTTNLDQFVNLMNQHPSNRMFAMNLIAAMPPKDQAELLANILRHGTIAFADESYSGNTEDKLDDLQLEDKIVLIASRLLGQASPVLPSARKQFISHMEANALISKLQALKSL